MFMTDVNDVKIYNLSAGKSLPDVGVIHCVYSSIDNGFCFLQVMCCVRFISVVDRSKTTKAAKQICGFEKAHRVDPRL